MRCVVVVVAVLSYNQRERGRKKSLNPHTRRLRVHQSMHANKTPCACLEHPPPPRYHQNTTSLRNHQSIPNLHPNPHPPFTLLRCHHPHRLQIPHNPVRPSRQDFLDGMARHEPNDLAPGRLAGADPRRRVLEHEELLVVAGEAEALASEAVARRVGLAVGDGLGGDEVGWGGEVEDFEPLGGGVSFWVWVGGKGGRGGGGVRR